MFGKKTTYSLFIDVSSSSVTIALVEQLPDDYKTIWYKKERFVVLEDTSDAMYFKKISTALLNCFLALETEGFAKMSSGKGKAITTVRAIIGAPWSYTLVRKNTFVREDAFVLTKKFIQKFAHDTDARVTEDLQKGIVEISAELELLSSDTISTKINGYAVENIEDKEAYSLEMVRLLGLYDTKLTTQIKELCEKKLPSATLYTVTNMQVLQRFIKNTLFLTDTFVCDVSGEVIETAVIEKGQLVHVSYAVTGLHAIVRDLAVEHSLPSEHVLAALKEGKEGFFTRYPAEKAKAEKIFAKHSTILATALASLTEHAGSKRHVFLRTEPGYEAFFSTLLEQAFTSNAEEDVALHVFTPKLFKKDNVTDAKTNIAAFVFHNFKKE